MTHKDKDKFKIETTKKKAEIFFPDESHLDGFFFASPRAQVHEGCEFVFDLLTSERNALPFELMDGEMVVLQKHGVAMVALEGNELNKNLPSQEKIAVQVCFISGKTIEGYAYINLPKTHSRLSDFLNLHTEFFYLEVDDKDFLINSHFIKMVRENS